MCDRYRGAPTKLASYLDSDCTLPDRDLVQLVLDRDNEAVGNGLHPTYANGNPGAVAAQV